MSHNRRRGGKWKSFLKMLAKKEHYAKNGADSGRQNTRAKGSTRNNFRRRK